MYVRENARKVESGNTKKRDGKSICTLVAKGGWTLRIGEQ